MMKGYKEVRGILVKKKRNVFGKYIFVLDENGMKSRIYVGKMIFEKAELYTKWTIGHINGKVVNVRPGFCKTEDDWVEEFEQFQFIEQLNKLEFAERKYV